MNDVPFHATRMGQQYYERTLPELVRQIARLAEAVERLVEVQADDERPQREPG
jgi:hypothetical protein